MHHLDRHRAFADGDGNALCRSGARVADAEHALAACLERERPVPVLSGSVGYVIAGEQEAVLFCELALEPAGTGIGADEDEQGCDVDVAHRSSGGLNTDAAKSSVAFGVAHDRVWQEHDAWMVVELVDEIARHGLVEAVPADDQVDPPAPFGEEERRLSR